MFADLDQVSQRNKTVVYPELSTHGYIEIKLEQDPIFKKVRMNFKPSDKITHMAVANNYMVLAMANNILFRMEITQNEKYEEISIAKYAATTKLSNLFLDPLGQHMLLAFTPLSPESSPELVYLSRKSAKLKPTVKCRGHDITAVSWNYENESDITTGPILLGTSKGLIFETEITQEGDKFFQSSLEQYWRQVFDIGKGNNTPITGLQFHRIPNTDKYFILVTTHKRLYHFVGQANSEEKSLLQHIFNGYLNKPEKNFHELSNLSKHYKLAFSYDKDDMSPTAFAWMTETDIYYSKVCIKYNELVLRVLRPNDTKGLERSYDLDYNLSPQIRNARARRTQFYQFCEKINNTN